MTTASHLIVLIPGFLGFDRLGDFTYFRETVTDALRSGLADKRSQKDIAIAAATTHPAGSLASRQAMLIDQLHGFLERRPGAQLHLIGHSTGGLDAELLLRTPLLCEGRALTRSAGVRAHVRSVTTISAPLAGTTVSDSAIAKLFALQTPDDFLSALRSKLLLRAPGLVASLFFDLVALVQSDAAVARLVFGALHQPSALHSFVLELLLQRSLAVDLSPKAIKQLLEESREDPAFAHVQRARFLTIARAAPDPTPEGRLFERFYANVRAAAKPDADVAELGRELMARAADGRLRVIGEGPLPLPIDERASDGVVNTARQLFLDDSDELERAAGLVIADHIDVVGYFRRAEGPPNGFLSSGSNFDEQAFQALYSAVSDELLDALGG